MTPDHPIPEAIKPNQPVNINIEAQDGKIVIQFSRPIETLILNPIEGVVIANTILSKVITASNPANQSRIIRPA